MSDTNSFSFENINKSKKENLLKSFSKDLFESQSLLNDEISKAIEADTLEKGGKRATFGEIREWSGKKYQKTTQGWIPYKGKELSHGDVDVTDNKPEKIDKEEKSKKDDKKEDKKLDLSKHTDKELDEAINIRLKNGSSEKDPEVKQLMDEKESRSEKEDKKEDKPKVEPKQDKNSPTLVSDIKKQLKDLVSKMTDEELIDKQSKHNGGEIMDLERHMLANDALDEEIKLRGLQPKKKDNKSYDEIRKTVGQKYTNDMINSIKESLLDSGFNSPDLKIKHNGTQDGEINAIGQKVDSLYKELRPGMEHKDLTEEGVKDILEGMIASYNNYDGDSKFKLD